MKICEKCGFRYDGNECPNCGYGREREKDYKLSKSSYYSAKATVYGPRPFAKAEEQNKCRKRKSLWKYIILLVGSLLGVLLLWIWDRSYSVLYGPPPVEMDQKNSDSITSSERPEFE